ncbi:MAG: M24 family metallopeptidase [bacterium]
MSAPNQTQKNELPGKTVLRRLAVYFIGMFICALAGGCGGGESNPTIETQYPIAILDANGIASARAAAEIAVTCQQAAAAKLSEARTARVTEQEVVDAVKAAASAAGADAAWCYPPIVATGSDEILIHGDFTNDSTHAVATDAIAFVDLAPRYHGICADVSRTYFFEPPTQRMRDAFAAVTVALQAAAGSAAPGVSATSLYNTMKNALEASGGFGANMISIPGHGLSSVVHSGPFIYSGYNGTLAQNIVLALEPSLIVDGSFRMHIEDDFLITATGAVRLTTAPDVIEDMILP